MKPIKLLAFGGGGIVILGLAAFLFSWKFPPPQKPDITLSISAAHLRITGSSGNTGTCRSSSDLGCVRISRWRRANIGYRLVGLPDWEFSRIQLVAEPSPKLDFGTQTGFTQEMMDDFYVNIGGTEVHPDSDGIITLNGLADGREFTLMDRNEYTQIYHYQIEACNGDCKDACEDDYCKRTDPKIENEGDN